MTVLDAAPPDGPDAFVQADVTDIGALRRAFAGQDAVIHLAAIPNPRTAPPEVTFRTNVEGTFAVLQAAEEAGVRRVVVASSDSVVGFHYNPPDWKPQYLPIDENHPLCPTEFYSLSKQVTETICRSYAQRGRLEVVVIRPTHIVFPPEYPELEARGSDLMNYHLWTYVAPEDVARGFQLALALREVRYDVLLHLGRRRAEHAADVGAGARALWLPSRDQAPGALRAPADRLGAGRQPGARGAGLRAEPGLAPDAGRAPASAAKPEPECRPWPRARFRDQHLQLHRLACRAGLHPPSRRRRATPISS